MQGIILAAGMGKRLKELTSNNTKCMVKVDGVTLIERTLTQLEKLKLSRIVIVIGYEGLKLVDFINTLDVKTPVIFIDNPIYNKTNNIYSLALAKQYLVEDDTLLLESDIIFEFDVLKSLLDDPRETLALVDKYESWMDGTVMKVDKEDNILSFVPGKHFQFQDIHDYYKTVNIYKFSQHFSKTHYVPFLDAYTKALGNNEYYEQVLRVITMLDDPEIKAKRLTGQRWYEIDDIQDLDIATSIFATDQDRLGLIQHRYGGYWRYPKLLDFCYLVNPYFPPQKLMDEMKVNFESLITQYPSGMQVNSLLASRIYGIRQNHIVVGNGAAELIKCYMESYQGRVGFIRPTFEEYPNRYRGAEEVTFVPDNDGMRYTADDLMAYFEKNPVDMLTVINPDNPSGNYIAKEDVLRLADWCDKRNVTIMIDESFVDFAEEDNNSLLDEDILQTYKNLIVIKSISKSYGVPGIRLGVLASWDEAVIQRLKASVAIWNINSFGEFFMQIEQKYKGDYKNSLHLLKETRTELIRKLSEIEGLKVYPSEANYVMVEIMCGYTARQLTSILLKEDKILIKDLSSKMLNNGKQYIRIAVRSKADNEKLLEALDRLMKN
jgi:histidinol-phosphate/aromatic aminotransferase/cobyric acid decarboxylase-like protein/choline kinase